MTSTRFANRTVLITGGTGGVGLEAARALRAQGAAVIIGSRDPSRYEKTSSELGGEGVYPFIADITDPGQVEGQLENLRSSGLEPTDIIHAAAGGLEPLLRTLARVMTGLKKLRGPERDRAHAAAIDELATLVAETRELAMNVNCACPSKLLGLLVPTLPIGGSLTFYISVWSSFYPHPQIPIYYQNIAESKHAMEIWLEGQAPIWASSRHITTAVVSSTWIRDTRIGQVLDRFCAEPMPPADRDRWRSTYVSCAELVEATLEILDHSGPDSSGGLARIFLPGPGEVIDHMGRDDGPMACRVLLAANAPSWSDEPLTSS